MPIDIDDIKNQVITDIQKQPFDGQAQLPAGAVATAEQYVFVLGNGRTLRIVGVKLAAGTPRLVIRLSRTQQVEDTESIA